MGRNPKKKNEEKARQQRQKIEKEKRIEGKYLKGYGKHVPSSESKPKHKEPKE